MSNRTVEVKTIKEGKAPAQAEAEIQSNLNISISGMSVTGTPLEIHQYVDTIHEKLEELLQQDFNHHTPVTISYSAGLPDGSAALNLSKRVETLESDS